MPRCLHFVQSSDARHQGGTFQYLLSCVIADPVHSVTLLGQSRYPRAHQTQSFKVSFLRSCRSCLLQLSLRHKDCENFHIHSPCLFAIPMICHLLSVSCGACSLQFPFSAQVSYCFCTGFLTPLHRSRIASAQVSYCLCPGLVLPQHRPRITHFATPLRTPVKIQPAFPTNPNSPRASADPVHRCLLPVPLRDPVLHDQHRHRLCGQLLRVLVHALPLRRQHHVRRHVPSRRHASPPSKCS